MIRFQTSDLKYIDHERKSSKKFGSQESIYHIIHFVDLQTKRAVYLYDWSGLEPDLSPDVRYYAEGYVNFQFRTSFLVLDGLARIINGVKYHINMDLEGITKIKTRNQL